METPFVYGKVAKSNEFTNRIKDVTYLTNNFKGLINTIIVSPRRWGKTSLVNKVAEQFESDNNYFVCKIDVFNCRTRDQFYSAFANSVLKASVTDWEGFAAGVKKYLSALLPKIALSDSVQSYELSFGVDFNEKSLTIDEILDLPYKIALEKNRKFIVCIDEFQNVSDYEDFIGFQQALRAHWQQHDNVCYCLFGSKRHMLLKIFNEYNMPFYKFGDILFLEKISTVDWIKFISGRFTDTNKEISDELSSEIAKKVNNHPYYVQQLSQQVWLRTEKNVTEETVSESFESLINQLSLLFTNLIDSMTIKQINFLIAIAKGEKNFSSKQVLSNYNLGTSANIKNLKNFALDKDLIDIKGDLIEFQDPMFEYWILNNYLKN
ncbi:MAG TPA: ATPase [Paludibacter sp.]|nr:ATPase [Paludibacter sp.]